MEEQLEITYRYRFEDGREVEFPIVLLKSNLLIQNSTPCDPPFWAELQFNRCDVCTLDQVTHSYCPVALNLSPVVEAFRDFFAYEAVDVLVTTQERNYSKSATIQEGLSALLGLIMVTSSCPVMERLKPMVRFHLPFAALEESTYRMLSMYLMAQLYRKRRGLHADWDLAGLDAVYVDIGNVNEFFAKRLLAAAKKDANVNAMVNLDCLAKMVPFTVEELLEEMDGYFSALLDCSD